MAMTPEELDAIEERMVQASDKLNPVVFRDISYLIWELRRQVQEIKNLKLCMDSEDYHE